MIRHIPPEKALAFILFLLAFPILALSVSGAIFLLRQDFFLLWCAIAASCSLGAAVIFKRIKLSPLPHNETTIHAGWEENDWKFYESLKADLILQIRGLEQPPTVQALGEVLEELLRRIAHEYHPTSSNALLEVRALPFLREFSLLCIELSESLENEIPLHSALTLQQLLNVRAQVKHLSKAYTAYRIIRPLTNPWAAIFQELQASVTKRAASAIMNEASTWFLEEIFFGFARHLITLYKGVSTIPEESAEQSSWYQEAKLEWKKGVKLAKKLIGRMT